jgi:photosystem II stability/assembly factor-like uncharacterized protein
MKIFYTLILFGLIAPAVMAQPWMSDRYLNINQKKDSAKLLNFYAIQQAFAQYEKEQDALNKEEAKDKKGVEDGEGKFEGYAQYKRWANSMEPRVYPSGDITLPSHNYQEFQKYLHSNFYTSRNTIASNATGNWVPLGPTGTVTNGDFAGAARVNFIRFDPTNSNIMWTVSPLGGLWKSVNGGANWTTGNTDQLALIGCSDIAINPLNTQVMYLATGDANGTGSQLTISSIGIFKSTNGGITWGANTLNWQVGWGRSIYKLLIHPQHPDTVFAATSIGLFRTIDGGANWISMQVGLFTDIEFKPGNPNILYATSGVNSNGTFYKSTDGGSNFVPISSGLPIPTNVARLEIGVTAADTNYVYVVGVNKNTYDCYGFYRSIDGGDNFTLRSAATNILSGLPKSQAWYNLSMAVSPLHRDTILLGATNLYRSLDGGLSWSKHSSENGGFIPYVHPDHHAIEFLPGSDAVYFSGNDGGVFKTTDYGNSWNTFNEGLQIAQMYKLGTSPFDPYRILTGHQDMGTQTYYAGSWHMFTPNTGDGMECIYGYTQDSIRYLESYEGRVIQTYNNYPLYNIVCSTNTAGVHAKGNWITPIVMNPQTETTLLVGKAQVWRTLNAGFSFTQVGDVSAGGGNVVVLAYAPSDSNFIYAAKSNRLFVSTNGNSFSDRTGTLPIALASITSVVVCATNPSKVWVCFSGYNATAKVWYSPDAGLSWSNYSTGLPNLPVNCIVYQNASNDGLYVGTDVGVYFVDNSLASWQAFFTGLPNVDVEELEIAETVGKIRAATNGRGLWESDLAVVVPASLTWTGVFSSDWNDPKNWIPNAVPTSKQDVVIPELPPAHFYPVINITGLACRNISISSNANFTLPVGNGFKVKGN